MQAGRALTETMAREAQAEMERNPRYRWIGELPRWQAIRLLARSRLLVLSSVMEGGANVISEALAVSVPVISSRISGSIGLLGTDYPGYFEVGDTEGLAQLLTRVEGDTSFYERLQEECGKLQGLVDPRRERESLRALVEELER